MVLPENGEVPKLLDMTAQDAVHEGVRDERNAVLEWHSDMDSAMDKVCNGRSGVYHAPAAPLHHGQLIILDAGADVSFLPHEMKDQRK